MRLFEFGKTFEGGMKVSWPHDGPGIPGSLVFPGGMKDFFIILSAIGVTVAVDTPGIYVRSGSSLLLRAGYHMCIRGEAKHVCTLLCLVIVNEEIVVTGLDFSDIR